MLTTNVLHSLSLPSTGFIRLKKVLQFIPISRSSWYLGIKSGKYPAPVHLGANTTAWRVQDIHTLIEKINKKGFDDETK